MKKFVLLLGFVVVTTIGFSSHGIEKDFEFPEYSSSLDFGVTEGCFAQCGSMTSCAGSGNCVCSCESFKCTCTSNEPTPDPGNGEIGISIDKKQYENIKNLAELLYYSNNDKGIQAYVHLKEMITALKGKNHKIFHKETENYLSALHGISSNSLKEKLNLFFEGIGANDRV